MYVCCMYVCIVCCIPLWEQDDNESNEDWEIVTVGIAIIYSTNKV